MLAKVIDCFPYPIQINKLRQILQPKQIDSMLSICLGHFLVYRRRNANLFFEQPCGMTIIIHITDRKSLGDGKIGVQQRLLQFVYFIIYVILMGGYTGVLFEQLYEMGYAEICRLCGFFNIIRFIPMCLYILFTTFNLSSYIFF